MQSWKSAAVLAALLGAAACARNTVPGDDDSTAGPPAPGTVTSGTQQSDWAAIERLEGEAKALASVTGCQSSADCRSAPVGSRACGGPRYYIPWCARTTDSAALYRKLDEVAAAEQAYNRKYDVVSTCEMRLPPEVQAVGGSCIAK